MRKPCRVEPVGLAGDRLLHGRKEESRTIPRFLACGKMVLLAWKSLSVEQG